MSWRHSLAAPLNSVAGLCVQALSSSCPLWLGSVSRPCPPLVLCGWAGPCPLWPGSVSGSCPPLVLVLAAPLNSVAGLCGPAYWRGRTSSDVKTTIVLKLFGIYAGVIYLWQKFEGSETVLPDLRAWWCHEDKKSATGCGLVAVVCREYENPCVFNAFYVFARRLSALSSCNANKLSNLITSSTFL